MTSKKFFIIIVVIAITFGVIGFGVSRLTQTPAVIEKQIDTQEFDRMIDSVVLVAKQAQFIIDAQNILLDSLNKELKNKNQHNYETKQIKNFTSSSRAAWSDSVLHAAGLK